MDGSSNGFLLTRQWRDTPSGLVLSYWLAGPEKPIRVQISGERAVCFVDRTVALPGDVAAERRRLDLLSLDGEPVDALYFSRQGGLRDAAERCRHRGIALHEADLKPADRFLMERFVTAGMAIDGAGVDRGTHVSFENPQVRRCAWRPALRWISLDIETEGLDGALYSIGVHTPRAAFVFMVSDAPVEAEGVTVHVHPTEAEVLAAFFGWLRVEDPDLILGWNVVGFDLAFLERKCREVGVAFDFGRGRERAVTLAPQSREGIRVARLPGRVALDGIELLRAAFWSFESFELEHVAQTMLGRGKTIHGEADRVREINTLYRRERSALATYNAEDCKLVAEIFAHANLVEFAMRRAELTGLALDRLGGSVAAFDHLYLPRLHRKGRVAPSLVDVPSTGASPGGYVLDSRPGLYSDVLLLDFKSLYPSIIRTFRIDPLGMAAPGADPVEGFRGATFARVGGILPDIIDELWRERDAAKQRRDGPLSQAVKILMNSFYGVLGANGCRFHDARLASSITLRGHEIIRRSREHIQACGHAVIYGDTDSLFVVLGDTARGGTPQAVGQALVDELNAWWTRTIEAEHGLHSYLEMEFETHFRRFLMPTVRGEQTGSKKRYAGLVEAGGERKLVVKGLESVRTDWTPLARRFQRELYRRIFLDEPFEDFVQSTLEAMLAGELDEELIYRKRLRRRVSEYERNVPPHVQAARKLESPGRWIRYIITASGPEPVRPGRPLPRPDYVHYRERQLAPAANGILAFLQISFEALTDAQLEMF